MVEHLVYTERVGGSSPSPPTRRFHRHDQPFRRPREGGTLVRIGDRCLDGPLAPTLPTTTTRISSAGHGTQPSPYGLSRATVLAIASISSLLPRRSRTWANAISARCNPISRGCWSIFSNSRARRTRAKGCIGAARRASFSRARWPPSRRACDNLIDIERLWRRREKAARAALVDIGQDGPAATPYPFALDDLLSMDFSVDTALAAMIIRARPNTMAP